MRKWTFMIVLALVWGCSTRAATAQADTLRAAQADTAHTMVPPNADTVHTVVSLSLDLVPKYSIDSLAQAPSDTAVSPDTLYTSLYSVIKKIKRTDEPEPIIFSYDGKKFKVVPSMRAEVSKLNSSRRWDLTLSIFFEPEKAARKNIMYVYAPDVLLSSGAWKANDVLNEDISMLDRSTFTQLNNDRLPVYTIQTVTFKTRHQGELEALYKAALDEASRDDRYIVTDRPVEGVKHSLKVVGDVHQVIDS